MKSINIEILMGHSIGISDSYYRITGRDLLEDYLTNAVDLFTINESNILRRQVSKLSENTNGALTQLSSDTIASLSDQILKLQDEIEILKNRSR